MNSKSPKRLAGLLAVAWLVVQVGIFVYNLTPFDPVALYWLLVASLTFNAWLAALLFDHWGNSPPPVPPAPLVP